jgi:hypothetical protein
VGRADEGKALYDIPLIRLLQEQASAVSSKREVLNFEEKLVAMMLSQFFKYWLNILEDGEL